jgi:hypothetical protein
MNPKGFTESCETDINNALESVCSNMDLAE